MRSIFIVLNALFKPALLKYTAIEIRPADAPICSLPKTNFTVLAQKAVFVYPNLEAADTLIIVKFFGDDKYFFTFNY